MTDQERVQNIRQITAENLKAGGFLFQLPEGTPQEEVANFEAALKTAQEKGLNLTLSPDVKVIDSKAVAKEPIVDNKVETTEAPKAEEPVVAQEEKKPEAQPTPQQPVQPQGIPSYMPHQQYVVGQQPWRYDPITGAPYMTQAPQAHQMPSYMPHLIQPTNGVPMNQMVYPNPGIYYAQPPQQQPEKKD